MSVVLCTLCLNELEWLPKLYKQHRHWPGLKKWIFVESADRVYAETNRSRVSHDGLSVDGTTEFLQGLAQIDPRVIHIPYGFSEHPIDPAQNKCLARQQYLDIAEDVHPDLLIVIDADEFYPQRFQQDIIDMTKEHPGITGFATKHREIWHPPVISHEPLFNCEVVGGFWDVLYCRTWRWEPGLRYVNDHNTPESCRGKLTRKLRRPLPQDPYYVHMAFTSNPVHRKAKHDYYVARGEGRTDHRQQYVDSRAAYLTWHPTCNPTLPMGARVVPYDGLIPEALQ